MVFENLNSDDISKFLEVEININNIDVNDEILNSLKEPNSKRLKIVKYDKLFHIGFTQNEINRIRTIIDKIFEYLTINYNIDNVEKSKKYFEYQLIGDDNNIIDDDNFSVIYFNNKLYRLYEHENEDTIFVDAEIDFDFHITVREENDINDIRY